MNKKFFVSAALALTLSLGFANLTFANHENGDPYEGMCQSTGIYTDVKLPTKELGKNKEARLVQLFGQCGDNPNVLIIDYIDCPFRDFPPRHRHNIQVFESNKKGKPYWKYVYNRVYVTDDINHNVLERTRKEIDKTVFINVVINDMTRLTVERFTSAKVGSPIFPHAEGNIICNRGSEDEGLLERGYMDYLQDMNK